MMPFYMLAGAAVGTRLFIAYPGFPYALLLAAVIVIYLNLERFGRAEWKSVRSHRARLRRRCSGSPRDCRKARRTSPRPR